MADGGYDVVVVGFGCAGVCAAIAAAEAGARVLALALHESALRLGVTFLPLSRVDELIVEDGRVRGVVCRVLPGGGPRAAAHRAVSRPGAKLANYWAPAGRRINAAADALWRGGAQRREFRAGAVVLAAGGFAFDREMVRRVAPAYRYLFTVGHERARTLDELAGRFAISPAGLRDTVAAYNDGIAGAGDPAGKAPELCSPVVEPPFYGVDISVRRSAAYFVPGLTLGGLRVDGGSGLVLDEDGHPVPGLYAAGRTAVGVCSQSYVSGLSLADCVFSGRRAGRHAAGRR